MEILWKRLHSLQTRLSAGGASETCTDAFGNLEGPVNDPQIVTAR